MFRTREPQESLWQSEFLITPRKARSPSEDYLTVLAGQR